MTWVCNFCNGSNEATRNVCKHCGEPQPGFAKNIEQRLKYESERAEKVNEAFEGTDVDPTAWSEIFRASLVGMPPRETSGSGWPD